MGTLSESWNGLRSAITGGAVQKTAAQEVGGVSGYLFKHTINAEGWGKVGGFVGDFLKSPFRLTIGAFKGAGMATMAVAKPVVGTVAAGSMAVGGAAGRGILHVAKQPLVGAMYIGEKSIMAVRRHPVIAGVAAVTAAVGLGSSWLSRRAEARTQDEMMAQMAQIQSLQPVQASANSYAGLQPGEYDALVAPQLRGGDGVPRTDNAERIAAARQAAAAAQPAPTNQPTAAL